MIPQEHTPDREVEPASGHFTPRLATDPAYRFTFELSLEDLARFDALPSLSTEPITVTDLKTGLQWLIRRAKCGADCFCDAEALPVENLNGFDAIQTRELPLTVADFALDLDDDEEAPERADEVTGLLNTALRAARAADGTDEEAATAAYCDLVDLLEVIDLEPLAEALFAFAQEINRK